MTQPLQPAKYYAKLICKYMKDLPDQYADDPKDVQKAVGLSDEEFKLGVDLCVQRGVIKLEDTDVKESKPSKSANGEKLFGDIITSKTTSPFSMDEDEDEDMAEMVG